jgi:hypothetical protein
MLMNRLTNRWLKECVDLTIVNSNDEDRNVSSSLVTDGSLVRFPLNLFSYIFFSISYEFFKHSRRSTRISPTICKF